MPEEQPDPEMSTADRAELWRQIIAKGPLISPEALRLAQLAEQAGPPLEEPDANPV